MKLNTSIRLGGLSNFYELHRDKAKLAIACTTATIAMTMAVFTFLSGGEGAAELSDAAVATTCSGPVGLFDSDYQHLVTVGKITRAENTGDYDAGDVRDPMVAPGGALTAPAPVTTQAKVQESTTLPPMWLDGIIWDPENPIAMINGLDLHVGDRIKGAKVVEIRIDSVVLSYKSKRHVLTVD